MPNVDRIPLLPRLLIAASRVGLRPVSAEVFDPLAAALARELPAAGLALALLRLRRHLGASRHPRGLSGWWPAHRRAGSAERGR